MNQESLSTNDVSISDSILQIISGKGELMVWVKLTPSGQITPFVLDTFCKKLVGNEVKTIIEDGLCKVLVSRNQSDTQSS